MIIKSCSPQGTMATIKFDGSVLDTLILLLLLLSDVGVERIFLVLEKLDTGIVKFTLLSMRLSLHEWVPHNQDYCNLKG